ncbi:MAG: YggT family protein [Actinobacteria bacterium]|nr:YggT family protein [Actinomycetota bacterium]
MGAVLEVLAFLLTLYMIVLMGRVVFDLIQAFSRGWRPSGFVLVLANLVYSLTDPPMRFFRRIVPPLRIGAVALDLGFLLLFLLVSFTRTLLLGFAAQM